MKDLKEAALHYHKYPEPGKIEVLPTKPYSTPEDLSLAYSPEVAYPCLEIKDNSRHYSSWNCPGFTQDSYKKKFISA